jgi:nitrate reductase gamma subunit
VLGPLVAIAALAVAASVLAYEVVFPLFALNVGLVWRASRDVAAEDSGRAARRLVVWTLAISVLAVGLAKTVLVAEHGQNSYQLGIHEGLLHHLAYLVSGAIKLNVGTYFLALPYVLWWIAWHRFSAAGSAVAAGSGLIAFAYLWRIARCDLKPFRANRVWRKLLAIGALTVVLGYAVFLANQNVLFRSAGIDNRVNAGAALGIAGMLVGAIGLLARRVDARRGAVVFAASIACAVAAGVFVIDALASFWTTAARQQHAIVSAVSRATDALPPSSTVILDGVCPEVGPAVVFADQWDFRGALQLARHDPSLKGDVASEALRAGRDGLSLEMTFLDRVYTRSYPYGRSLFVYDFSRRRLYPLPSRSRAATYLAKSRPSLHCLPQRGFAWGFDPEYRWTLL